MEKASQEAARDHFLQIIRMMNNNAILLRRYEDGHMEPVFVSEEFARMMECTVDEAMVLMKGLGFYKNTYPEDRPLVRSMMTHQVAYDGGTSLTIQKITAKRNKIWCQVHYAFIDDFQEHYVYCTYTDVTALKRFEVRLRSVYTSMGNNFYQVNERTLALLRVNLSKDSSEEVKGKDLYQTDSIAYSYSESMRQRVFHFPILAERNQFLQLFDKEKLISGYLSGDCQLQHRTDSRIRRPVCAAFDHEGHGHWHGCVLSAEII